MYSASTGTTRCACKPSSTRPPTRDRSCSTSPTSCATLFRYHAGAVLHVPRARSATTSCMRCYSMSSAPATDADLTVTVKRVPGGSGVQLVRSTTSPPAICSSSPSRRACSARASVDVPVVAFCGGSGVTPVFSIVKQVLADDGPRHVQLLYANRRPRRGDLRRGSSPAWQLITVIDSTFGTTSTPSPAISTARRSRQFVAGTLDADFYICGPTPFMDLVESTLLDAGVDPGHISIERFVTGGPAPAEVAARGDRRWRRGDRDAHARAPPQVAHRSVPSRATPSSRRHAATDSKRRSRVRPATAPRAWRSSATGRRRCGRTTR